MVTLEQKYDAALRIMNFMVDILPEKVAMSHAAAVGAKLNAFEQGQPSTIDANNAVLEDQMALADAEIASDANAEKQGFPNVN